MRSLFVFFFTCFVIGCATSSVTQSEADFGRVGEPFGSETGYRDDPVEACLDVRPATPEEHLASWRSTLREYGRRPEVEPMSQEERLMYHFMEPARAYAEAMPHVIASGDRGTACHALFITHNISCGMCQLQSLRTRAILRCYLDELSELCTEGYGDRFPELAERARFCLYERGCESMEGEYRP
ncbi:hypothetical protein EDM68_01520 [Candidatus Uhrbacteria bacterium]|nr:MAG: hypothetical protein EDM68_01520 [Candidatus Uhrbacteria bacterium]